MAAPWANDRSSTMLPLVSNSRPMCRGGRAWPRSDPWANSSMPLGRSSVLLSKLLTSAAVLGVAVVLLPELAATVAARIAYGAFPDANSLVCPEVGGMAIALLLVVLSLAASVFLRSQRSVIGVALCVGLIIPGVIDSFWPAASPWWPISIDHWVENLGAGQPLQAVTPIVWLATMAVLAVAAKIGFDREEL